MERVQWKAYSFILEKYYRRTEGIFLGGKHLHYGKVYRKKVKKPKIFLLKGKSSLLSKDFSLYNLKCVVLLQYDYRVQYAPYFSSTFLEETANSDD